MSRPGILLLRVIHDAKVDGIGDPVEAGANKYFAVFDHGLEVLVEHTDAALAKQKNIIKYRLWWAVPFGLARLFDGRFTLLFQSNADEIFDVPVRPGHENPATSGPYPDIDRTKTICFVPAGNPGSIWPNS